MTNNGSIIFTIVMILMIIKYKHFYIMYLQNDMWHLLNYRVSSNKIRIRKTKLVLVVLSTEYVITVAIIQLRLLTLIVVAIIAITS